MKILRGYIIRVTSEKTVVVETSRKIAHPLYKKLLTRTKKFLVDPNSKEVKIGDQVKIEETRPISKNKHFKIVEVYKK